MSDIFLLCYWSLSKKGTLLLSTVVTFLPPFLEIPLGNRELIESGTKESSIWTVEAKLDYSFPSAFSLCGWHWHMGFWNNLEHRVCFIYRYLLITQRCLGLSCASVDTSLRLQPRVLVFTMMSAVAWTAGVVIQT